MKESQIFISYSHTDREYLDRLLIHLKPLEKEGLIDIWVDTRLRPGDHWQTEIEKALKRATVAILLVSADFLASDFITENELPPLLLKAEEQGTRIIPVIVKPCRFVRDKNLQQFKAFNNPNESVVRMTYGKQEKLYDTLAAEVERACKEPEEHSKSKKRTLMEHMILNTLWTKQVNRWPDLSLKYTFSMSFTAPSESQAFREAGAKLIGEGLITEAENSMYMLTINGFDYCRKHFNEFPPEQWWPEEQINKENLDKVIMPGT